MPFECPSCSERRQLRGRREDELVQISCLSCGHEWTHDPWTCPRCGERMHAVRKPLLQRARGTQQSIVGFNTGKACPSCDVEDRRDGWLSAT